MVQTGLPFGYSSDVAENLQALASLGYGNDPRLVPAWEWLLAKQDNQGRFRNEHTFTGRMWAQPDKQGQPSKWVTLRVCRLLKTRAENPAGANR